MIPRFAEQTLRARLVGSPAVVLLGPRQVGKTTTARGLARNWPTEAIYLDMERPADRRRLDDADTYLRGQQGILGGQVLSFAMVSANCFLCLINGNINA